MNKAFEIIKISIIKHLKKVISLFVLLFFIVISNTAIAQISVEEDCQNKGGTYIHKEGYCHVNTASYNCGYPEDVSDYVDKMRSICWSCRPLNTMVVAIQTLADRIYEHVRGGVMSLMAVVFCIWLLLVIMDYMVGFRYKGSADFYGKIGKMSLRFAFAIGFLSAGKEFWNYVITPAVDIMFDYGTAVMNAGQSQEISTSPVEFLSTKVIGDGVTAGGIISAINAEIMELIATGWIMLTASMRYGEYCIPFGNWSLFIFALLVLFTAIIYFFAIPLKFIDILFRFGIFLVMMPLYILAWVFPIGKDFFKKGSDLLLHVVMSFLVYAIVIGICFALLKSELGLPDIAGLTDESSDGVAESLSNTLISSPASSFRASSVADLDNSLREFEGGWVKFLTFIAYMLYSFLVINAIDNIIGTLSSSYRSSDVSSSVKSAATRTGSSVKETGIQTKNIGKTIYNRFKR